MLAYGGLRFDKLSMTSFFVILTRLHSRTL